MGFYVVHASLQSHPMFFIESCAAAGQVANFLRCFIYEYLRRCNQNLHSTRKALRQQVTSPAHLGDGDFTWQQVACTCVITPTTSLSPSNWQVVSWYQPLYALGESLIIRSARYQVAVNMTFIEHDDVIKWKHSPRYWPFVRGIHRSPVNSPHKGQWRGALMFSLIFAWINDWVNKREAGDWRHHLAHYDVTVMIHIGFQKVIVVIDKPNGHDPIIV